jgi:uncharacterized protein YaaW (UPF0174 family)
MIEKNKLINRIQKDINSSLTSILKNISSSTLNDEIRNKILNNINKNFMKEMGDNEFEKFCNYLNSRNITLYIGNKQFKLLVCFYNGFMFFTISDVINDYYKFLESDK